MTPWPLVLIVQVLVAFCLGKSMFHLVFYILKMWLSIVLRPTRDFVFLNLRNFSVKAVFKSSHLSPLSHIIIILWFHLEFSSRHTYAANHRHAVSVDNWTGAVLTLFTFSSFSDLVIQNEKIENVVRFSVLHTPLNVVLNCLHQRTLLIDLFSADLH